MTSEIRPCPFCRSVNVELVCSGSAWFVQCNECDANGSTIEDGERDDTRKAVDVWNRLSKTLLAEVTQRSNERIAQECEQAFQRGGPRVYVVEKGKRIVPTLMSARRAALNISDDEAVWARRKVGGRYQWRCIATQPGGGK
jgi:hypothetical protein